MGSIYVKTFDAIDVALYVIHYVHNKNEGIDNLKLQKILFYIQVAFLRNYDKPIYKDDIVNWQYGFVVPNVYYKFNQYSVLDITDEYIHEDYYDEDDFRLKKRRRYCDYNAFISHQKEKFLIEQVVDCYMKYSAVQLSNKVRKLSLYKESPLDEIVSLSKIRKFLSKDNI